MSDLFEANGFRVSDWERERTDRLTVNVINPRDRDAARTEELRAEAELSLGATLMTPQITPVSA